IEILATRRARLSVKVNLQARATDSIGAYIDAVTPGGPAARAGLRSGDIITRLDGRSLLTGGVEAGPDESLPGLRLIELAARLEPNDTVTVEFRRGAERRTASLVTGDEPFFLFGPELEWALERTHEPRGLPRDMLRRRVPAPGPDPAEHVLALIGPLADLELAPMNPGLGRYFGVDEGVLVIAVPERTRLGLRPGDVVLRVDGRKPSGPGHLLRILRSYEAGEPFRLEVMRMKRRETVTGRIELSRRHARPGSW
ncbi:MAG TPA: PDZ domain-containing protein, partial [Gemmatimonadales bacterium]|nr:PDZ domain-containing protein [Gemmatimonadales bacterium]